MVADTTYIRSLWKRCGSSLDEDQIRQLVGRMIESKIRMKEHMIEQLQYKVETYKMARDMLEKGKK